MGFKSLVSSATTKFVDIYEHGKLKIAGAGLAVISTASSFLTSASAAEGDTANLSDDLVTAMSSVDYTVVLTCVVALIPAVFPAVFGLIAVRKGIGFVLGMVRGA